MKKKPWTIRITPEYEAQIGMLSQTEQVKIGSKVSELSQRPHPSRSEQTVDEDDLGYHFQDVEPADVLFADIGYELMYEVRALSKELRLVSIRHLEFSDHMYSL